VKKDRDLLSVLLIVGANCVRQRAFKERPYEIDFLGRKKLLYGRHPLQIFFVFIFLM